ncbi:MAG: hypothetical protein KAJ95_03565 [Gammaproteobacteria bacterium]|nr:hypothetical protein [Gammaproteobacteria bacterium]
MAAHEKWKSVIAGVDGQVPQRQLLKMGAQEAAGKQSVLHLCVIDKVYELVGIKALKELLFKNN